MVWVLKEFYLVGVPVGLAGPGNCFISFLCKYVCTGQSHLGGPCLGTTDGFGSFPNTVRPHFVTQGPTALVWNKPGLKWYMKFSYAVQTLNLAIHFKILINCFNLGDRHTQYVSVRPVCMQK